MIYNSSIFTPSINKKDQTYTWLRRAYRAVWPEQETIFFIQRIFPIDSYSATINPRYYTKIEGGLHPQLLVFISRPYLLDTDLFESTMYQRLQYR